MTRADWFSVSALLVSVGTALIAVILWRLSGPRFVVSVSSPLILEANPPFQVAFMVKVTNVGRAAATVQGWYLESKSSVARTGPAGRTMVGPDLPKRFEPYETAVWSIDLREVQREVVRDHPREVHLMRAVIHHAGRTTRSRNTVRIAEGSGQRRSKLAKMWHETWHPVGFLTGVAARKTVGGHRLSDLSFHLRNYLSTPLRSLRVDQVPAEGHEDVMCSLHVERRRLLLPGRVWEVPLTRWEWPDDRATAPVLRLRWRTLGGKRGETRASGMGEALDQWLGKG